jgi:hypothetical protein
VVSLVTKRGAPLDKHNISVIGSQITARVYKRKLCPKFRLCREGSSWREMIDSSLVTVSFDADVCHFSVTVYELVSTGLCFNVIF